MVRVGVPRFNVARMKNETKKTNFRFILKTRLHFTKINEVPTPMSFSMIGTFLG